MNRILIEVLFSTEMDHFNPDLDPFVVVYLNDMFVVRNVEAPEYRVERETVLRRHFLDWLFYQQGLFVIQIDQ